MKSLCDILEQNKIEYDKKVLAEFIMKYFLILEEFLMNYKDILLVVK